MHEERAAALRRHAPLVRPNYAAARALHRLSIRLHPGAHLTQPRQCRVGQLPVGLRADVEQQVGVVAGGADEQANEVGGGFVRLIRHAIAPRAVHRLARLERQAADGLAGEPRLVLARQIALEDLDVLAGEGRRVVVVGDEARWLQAVNERVLRREAPGGVGHAVGVDVLVPHAVEPDGADGAVAGEQLGELAVHEGAVVVPAAFAGATGAEAGAATGEVIVAAPVEVRIVEVQPDAVSGAGVGQLTDHVAAEGRGLDDVEVRLAGGEHGEAVVVARGDADVLRAGVGHGLDPAIGVEGGGIEAAGQPRVLVAVDVAVVHHPFAVAGHRVEPPVNEDAEAIAAERLARLEILFRRRVVRRLCARPEQAQGCHRRSPKPSFCCHVV